MRLILSSSIQQTDGYASQNQSVMEIEKIADIDSVQFPCIGYRKEIYSLQEGNTFYQNITDLLPTDTELAFLVIDIYDTETDITLQSVNTFQLQIDSLNLGQISKFELFNVEEGWNKSIIINNIDVEEDKVANLVILIGYR